MLALPGLVAFYDICLGNGLSLLFLTTDLHGSKSLVLDVHNAHTVSFGISEVN